MKHLIVPMLIVGGCIALTTTEASAVIYCAAGVYRAGCVARPAVGAVVVAPLRVLLLSLRARSLSRLSAAGSTDWR